MIFTLFGGKSRNVPLCTLYCVLSSAIGEQYDPSLNSPQECEEEDTKSRMKQQQESPIIHKQELSVQKW